MRNSVLERAFDFVSQTEGIEPFMYCDQLNLVSTGIGHKIDNGPMGSPSDGSNAQRAAMNTVVSAAAMAPALTLPWTVGDDGPRASQSDVASAWTTVKTENARSGLASHGGGAYAGLTNLRLSRDAIFNIFSQDVSNVDSGLRAKFPTFEQWPADAQFGALRMGFAMGVARFDDFPIFSAAVNRGDFDTAAQESFFNGGGGTKDNRSGVNAQIFQMFRNAAEALRRGVDIDRVYFPGTVDNPGVTNPSSLPVASITGGGGVFKGVAVIAGTAALGAVSSAVWDWWKKR